MPGRARRRKRLGHPRETLTFRPGTAGVSPACQRNPRRSIAFGRDARAPREQLLPHPRRRWPVRARPDRIARVLSRLIAEHLIALFTDAAQRRRRIDLLTVLIRIACETRLLSARFLRRANLVRIFLRSHLV